MTKTTWALVAILICSCGAEVESPLHRAARKQNVPVEVLAAIGWTQSRFTPTEADEHDGRELRFGVTQLTKAQLDDGAARIGRDVVTIEDELEATAALLRANVKPGEESWDAWLDAASRLLVDDEDARSGARNELRIVLADGVRIDSLGVDIAGVDGLSATTDEFETSSFELTMPGQYPPLEWYAASSANQMSGRGGGAVTYVLIHVTEGSYWSTLSWFRQANPYSASTQYVIRSSDGHIAQMVSEANTAWHAGNDFYSRNSIGIEHEGFVANPQIWFTEAMYRSSAQLVCAIAKRYGIPVDSQHIIGHFQVPNSRVGISAPPATAAQFASNKWAYGGTSNHFDPGTGWRWDYYLGLIRSCVNGSTPIICEGSACWPSTDLRRNDESRDVYLLQQDLVYLGHLSSPTMLTGPGTFGPATLAALQNFQRTRGIGVTGVFDANTRAAMRTALLAKPSTVPAANLSFGVTSSAVTTLQTQLTAVGFSVPATGYFGPMTQDAVLRFQNSRGVPGADGSYGPLTRMALAARIARGN